MVAGRSRTNAVIKLESASPLENLHGRLEFCILYSFRLLKSGNSETDPRANNLRFIHRDCTIFVAFSVRRSIPNLCLTVLIIEYWKALFWCRPTSCSFHWWHCAMQPPPHFHPFSCTCPIDGTSATWIKSSPLIKSCLALCRSHNLCTGQKIAVTIVLFDFPHRTQAKR